MHVKDDSLLWCLQTAALKVWCIYLLSPVWHQSLWVVTPLFVFPFTHPLKYYFRQFQIAYASMFRSETNVSIVTASTGQFTNQRFLVSKLTEKIKNEIKSYVDAGPFRFSVVRSTCCTPFP